MTTPEAYCIQCGKTFRDDDPDNSAYQDARSHVFHKHNVPNPGFLVGWRDKPLEENQQ